jgi:hypothetical protein
MPLEERHPRLVAEDVGAIRGAHDVAEHDRGEDAIVLRRRPDAGQELLDLVDDRIGVPGVGQVVDARELHELRPRDVCGEVSRVARVAEGIIQALEDERRDLDRGENRPHVDLGIHHEVLDRVARAEGESLMPSPPIPEGRVRGS